MQTKFAAKRVGTLNKFFTKISVGEVLAGQFDGTEPLKVLDLGAGEGSLSLSVVRLWPNVGVVTVDIDKATYTTLHENFEQSGCADHCHYVHDALDVELPSQILKEHGQFDIAVCNPPFFNPTWTRDHADILQRATLGDACGSVTEATAEVLFIAQSLALLKDGGRLAVIVPDSLITTTRALKFRKSLVANHTVESVLQLPINSFLETDAQCFIIVLEKGGGPTQSVKLLNVDADQKVSEPLFVEGHRAEGRMDYNYHSLRCDNSEKHTSLRDLGAEVFRGSLSTVQRKEADFPVFHTSDYKSVPDGKIELSGESGMPYPAKIVAEKGDILMARVDRNLHEKIGVVVSGSAAVTDCIYRIRLPLQNRNRAYKALCSDKGRKNLLALTKGVGARIIGKSDLLDMPLEISDS